MNHTILALTLVVFCVIFISLSTASPISLKNETQGVEDETEIKVKSRGRKGKIPLKEAYRMTMDDFTAFWDDLSYKMFACDTDQYYNTNLKTCEPCDKLCKASADSLKQCQFFCPDAYMSIAETRDPLIYVCLATSVVLLAMVVWNSFAGKRESMSSSCTTKTYLSDSSETNSLLRKTPENQSGDSSRDSMMKSSRSNSLEHSGIIATQTNHGPAQMAMDKDHPLPQQLRSNIPSSYQETSPEHQDFGGTAQPMKKHKNH